MVEVLGYIGSILVIVSMLMSSVTRLRVINIVGCAISAVYATIIQAFPTVVMNVILVLINGYFLLQLRKNEMRGS